MAESAEPSFDFIGSACPKDAEALDYHWEGSTLVINFSALTAAKGPGVSLLEARKNCSLTMNLKVPNGLKYTLVGYTADGFDSLGEGDSRTLTLSSFFQGTGKTASFESVVKGPVDDSFRVSGTAAAQDLVWSPCNAQRAHTITAAVRVNGSDRQQAAFAGVDSLRLRFRVGLCLPENSEAKSSSDQVSIEAAQ